MIGAQARSLRRPMLHRRAARRCSASVVTVRRSRSTAARLAVAVRREARGGGRAGRDRACCCSSSTGSSTRSTGPSGSSGSTASAARRCWRHGAARLISAARCSASYLLGFTSVYREGFETVLFLQSLRAQLRDRRWCSRAWRSACSRPCWPSACATFVLERKLPYKKMLIVTGVLIALVLVVMVGKTVRTHAGRRLAADHPARRRAPATGWGPGSASSRRSRRSCAQVAASSS